MRSMPSKSKKQVFLNRLLSTIVLWATVTAIFISESPWAFVSLVFVLGVAATYEFYSMAKKSNFPTDRIFGLCISITYLAIVSIILATEGTESQLKLFFIDSAAIAIAVLASFIYQLRRPIDGFTPLKRVASTTLGFLYIPFLFSFLSRLLFFTSDIEVSSAVPGAWIVLWLCVVTKFTDMGAYLAGTICGNFMKTHKMIPHISPGKTWEGFIGAIIIALGTGCGLYALFPEQFAMLGSWTHVISLGIILPLLAVVGDLAESVIKRCLNIKDSGSFLPGIGGALDLIDSLCFTAPIMLFYLYIVA